MSGAKAESIDEMDESFLACRDMRHRWDFLTEKITATYNRKVREITRYSICKGCSTERAEVFEIPSCDLKSRKYTYPDGYLFAPDFTREFGRVNVRDIRREVFSRHGIKF